jgi:hypothetical protein
MSSNVAVLLDAAISLHSGLLKPAKTSPYPYDPGPVLKYLIISLAFAAFLRRLICAWIISSDIILYIQGSINIFDTLTKTKWALKYKLIAFHGKIN